MLIAGSWRVCIAWGLPHANLVEGVARIMAAGPVRSVSRALLVQPYTLTFSQSHTRSLTASLAARLCMALSCASNMPKVTSMKLKTMLISPKHTWQLVTAQKYFFLEKYDSTLKDNNFKSRLKTSFYKGTLLEKHSSTKEISFRHVLWITKRLPCSDSPPKWPSHLTLA